MFSSRPVSCYISAVFLVGVLYSVFIFFFSLHLTIIVDDVTVHRAHIGPGLFSVAREPALASNQGDQAALQSANFAREFVQEAKDEEEELVEKEDELEDMSEEERIALLMHIMEDNIRDLAGEDLAPIETNHSARVNLPVFPKPGTRASKAVEQPTHNSILNQELHNFETAAQKAPEPPQKPAVQQSLPKSEPVQQPIVPPQQKEEPVQKPAVPVQQPIVPPQQKAEPVIIVPQQKAEPVQKPAVPVQQPIVPPQQKAEPVQKPAVPVQQPIVPPQQKAEPVQNPAVPAEEEGIISVEKDVTTRKLYNLTLILTESRHGSSWLLSVLGRPDNVMHFFEPLNHKISERFQSIHSDLSEEETQKLWHATKLAQICSCDMNRYDAGGLAGFHRNYINSKELSSKSVKDDCLYNRTTRVAKTIRLYDITVLQSLPELGCPDFRVVHLIRDPRAVLVSRMKTFHELYDGNKVLGPRVDGPMENFSDEYVGQAARDLCGHHMHSMQEGEKRWLEGRYTRVLYEEIALDPVGIAKKLFAFLGQPFTTEDEDFVYKSSHASTHGGGYDLNKNTSHVLNEWKGRILERHLEVIERECKDVFSKVGYKFGL